MSDPIVVRPAPVAVRINVANGPAGPVGPQGPQGLPGPNSVPADEAVATYIETPGTDTEVALRSTIDAVGVPRVSPALGGAGAATAFAWADPYASPRVDGEALGAHGLGVSATLGSRYGSLAEAQADFDSITLTSLSQQIDYVVLQRLLNKLPNSGNRAGGEIHLYGDFYIGDEELTSSRPSVKLIGSTGLGRQYSKTGGTRITGTKAGGSVLVIGTAGSSLHRGWFVENVELEDGSVGQDQIASALRLVRSSFNAFVNFGVRNVKGGAAVLFDSSGDVSQYNEFFSPRIQQCLHGFRVNDPVPGYGGDDNVIWGGSFHGTGVAGGIGIEVVSSMRVFGPNVHGFETPITMAGNNPHVDGVRGDPSGGAVDTYIQVLDSARDAKIVAPDFAGSDPATDYIRVESGARRTSILFPSSNQAYTNKAIVNDLAPDSTVIGGGYFRLEGVNVPKAPVGGGFKSITSAVTVSNDTTETTVGTYTMPAGFLVAGSVLKVVAAGLTDNVITSGTLTLRLKVGSVTLAQFILPSQGAASGRNWRLESDLVCRIAGSSGRVAAMSEFLGWGTSTLFNNLNRQAPGSNINTTTTQTLTLTAQWATADAGNVFTLDMFNAERVLH